MVSDVAGPSEYPVRFEVAYPEETGRWLILIRWLLGIPQLIVAELMESLAQLLAFFAFWVILFTGNYPESLFRLVVGAQRWIFNVYRYVLFHDGPYPPFSFDAGVYPHLDYDVQRQEQYNRWLPLVKWLLAIPHYIVLAVLTFVAVLVWLFSVVAVLVTGRFPPGAFDYLVGVGRWSARVNAYLLLQVDRYPPFAFR